MSCNGFNHPPDCNCGWGGVYYGAPESHPSLAWPMAPGSFINPNAKCPVCGAAVFFYRSPDGGRVFFDELGPPWPKHPCTAGQVATVTEPSSAYWEAKAYWDKWIARVANRPWRLPRGVFYDDRKWWKFVFDRLAAQANNHNYQALAAAWVLGYPPSVSGVDNVDLLHANKATIWRMAQGIRRYYEAHPKKTKRWFARMELELACTVDENVRASEAAKAAALKEMAQNPASPTASPPSSPPSD